MFKRLLWLTIGASLGAGTSWWVTRTIKQKIERYTPTRLTQGVANKARAVSGDVRAAVADGRRAMHDHEELLRGQLDARYAPRDQ